MTKPTKWNVRPAKTSISLGAQSDQSLRLDAQADVSLRCAHEESLGH